MPKQPEDPQKVTKAVARKIKKVATGPLLGPVEPQAPSERQPASVARLGDFRAVQATLRKLDGEPPADA